MRKVIFFILLSLCSCSPMKFIQYTFLLNVKEYNNNKLTECGYKRVTVEYNDRRIMFLDMSLYARQGYYVDAYGNFYSVIHEFNNSGVMLSAVCPYKKSYIISTRGKCLY